MSIYKKVSVITPCYNGEKFICRLLDSILMQDYPCIEMCVIDDGSTDDSAKIIQSYIPRFVEKGYDLTYLYQDNSGLPATINKGLQWMSGDYLVWPDNDDYYAINTAISELVHLLEASDEQTSMVRCHSHLVDEDTLEIVGKCAVNAHNDNRTDLFEDCLFAQNGFWFGAGTYMVKISLLREVLPSLTIYAEKNAGQNWQLLLPLLYKYKCLTLKKYLYSILVRANSHSRGAYSTYEQVIARLDSYERTILNTLRVIDLTKFEYQNYTDKIDRKYKKIRLQIMIDFKKSNDAKLAFENLRTLNETLPYSLVLKYYLMDSPALSRLLKKVATCLRKKNDDINC
ncbi:glycosyltransferase family 2 protein [Aeromonas veronii]|uniref:glycosyltransferase family 2 protein n=1 Tax=Aeromonas veronii TaxID=654 RepID=UPI00214DB9C2|nr:glycosyltransferase family 2 protein [Aeromonas veronii]MCR3961847.1 glycosyltransferase family 2 protein [Aeromonas veronii]